MLAALIPAAVQIIGGLVGNAVASGDKKAAGNAYAQAMQEIMNLGLPPDLSKRLVLDQFKASPIYSPEMERDLDQTTSEMATIKERTEGRDAQMGALNMMRNVASTGMTNQTQAALDEASRQQARQLQGNLGRLQQERQAQGLGNSGMAQMEQLMMLQGADSTLAEQQSRESANASRAALEAMQQYGSMGQSLRSDDWNSDSARAKAADELSRFNVEGRRSTQMRNVGSKNKAAEDDWRNQQGVSDKNIDLSNDETKRQNTAKRDHYNDRVDYASRRANILAGHAQRKDDDAAATQKQYAGYAGAAGKAATALAPSVSDWWNSSSDSSGGSYEDASSDVDAPSKYQTRRNF